MKITGHANVGDTTLRVSMLSNMNQCSNVPSKNSRKSKKNSIYQVKKLTSNASNLLKFLAEIVQSLFLRFMILYLWDLEDLNMNVI